MFLFIGKPWHRGARHGKARLGIVDPDPPGAVTVGAGHIARRVIVEVCHVFAHVPHVAVTVLGVVILGLFDMPAVLPDIVQHHDGLNPAQNRAFTDKALHAVFLYRLAILAVRRTDEFAHIARGEREVGIRHRVRRIKGGGVKGGQQRFRPQGGGGRKGHGQQHQGQFHRISPCVAPSVRGDARLPLLPLR